MHVRLPAQGEVDDGSVARDLMQPAADIVFISGHDTELAQLAAAHASLGRDAPSLALTNFQALGHPLSVDLYAERTLAQARLVVLRLLGGTSYWPHGVERLVEWARAVPGASLAMVPGDASWNEAFAARGSIDPADTRMLWRYLNEGGPDNAALALSLMVARATGAVLHDTPPPVPAPIAGVLEGHRARPADALLIIYRSLVQAHDLQAVEAMVSALAGEGLSVVPLFVSSLRHAVARQFLATVLAVIRPAVIVNATAFSADTDALFGETPVLQVAFAGMGRDSWAASARGLNPSDLAMTVVLPELDGRIIAGPVAFKASPAGGEARAGEPSVLRHDAAQMAAAAARAAALVRLRRTPVRDRRVAIILANYPNRDGRLANGVGLDTPQSCADAILAMERHGYGVGSAPRTGAALMGLLTAGPTNALGKARDAAGFAGAVRWPLADYRAALAGLSPRLRAALDARWGDASNDPHGVGEAIELALHRFDNLVVGIQPSRGYDIDPAATFHDPDLVPPHRYVATYLWLRQAFGAHALVHFGKHGNLEWLPGKSTGLSQDCWPAALIGPLPHVYPFIVNDPGEGVQAKRRASAVIVDHLTPPLSRAGLHADLARLEALSDEYALAADLDPRRADVLAKDIASFAGALNLDADLGLASAPSFAEQVRRIDGHLCDLKEMQIRDGLHVFGASPQGEQRADLALAIARLPRPGGSDAAQSLTRALARDLGLGTFDPLARTFGEAYDGPRPAVLDADASGPWRTHGDTVERLEVLARRLVAGTLACAPDWTATRAVLDWITRELLPDLDACGQAETAAFLKALDGRHVAPGPSGAPSRGRPDVLPTGRNFFAVDPRAVPTEAAFAIGLASAEALVARHWQEHGEWLRTVVFSAWGTANMRTGGDDVAQALALMGCRPVWEPASGRVTGFEIVSAADLRRPRVDVTFRVSGLFRDAFPGQMDLIDSAVRAVAALDEDDEANPIAAHARAERADLIAAGLDVEEAGRRAATRVFGARPGAYGAGLQALIDEGGWQDRADFAAAYLAWGGHAYGGARQGEAAPDLLAQRLSMAEAVVQAQDNREHDILDSDDYYQFMGGAAASIEALSGKAPAVYHTDTSRPEAPLVRSLDEEIARVVRGRASNPKWIAGVMRHGYKGAFEMAATVDYLFAFAATTHAVRSHHFDMLFAGYISDPAVRAFLSDANPDALREMADRFAEAVRRGLWQPRSNAAIDLIAALRQRPSTARTFHQSM
ncbi:cobaltochelatase subunit CobN [Phreatobacter sp.]|uniref:cobaltochelatase subunit CobN n=1 Tax=Phreatobacter sp. TaxID=1966341 RepID=UPI003F7078C0